MEQKKLVYYRVGREDEAWYRFRTTGLTQEDADRLKCPIYPGGIGASEIGTLLGLNNYPPVLAAIYHYKVGSMVQKREDNKAMLMGRIMEPMVKSLWCSYDGTDEGWVARHGEYLDADKAHRKNKQLRQARRVNAILVNKDYPYIFTNLDYRTESGTPSILENVAYDEGFPLEIKTINGFYAKQWESGIPPYHIMQVQQQMLITGSDYSELAVLVDGRELKVYPIKRSDDLCEGILIHASKFFKKIMEGREIYQASQKAYENDEIDRAEKLRAELDSLEPEPDDSSAYEQFYKERHNVEANEVEGDMETYCLGSDYKKVKEVIKILSAKEQNIKNKILRFIDKNKTEVIDYGKQGKITLKKNKNGVASLRVGIKESWEEEAKEIVEKMDGDE